MASEVESEVLDLTKEKIKEYAELCKTIRTAQEKLKILNKHKNDLYKEVFQLIKQSKVQKCNLSFGTLNYRKTTRKVMPSKKTMEGRFEIFFNTLASESEFACASPAEQAKILFKYIYVDSVETKKSDSVSITFSKEFRDQFKTT
jgi:hypothetical protein